MKAILILPVLLFMPIAIDAQVMDDFSDGSLADNLTWLGDTSEFLINEDLVLQLNATDGSESFIYTAVPAVPGDLLVQIDCRLDFDPSTSNTLRIYIWMDSPDPQIASGYFIELGSSGDEDKLQLFKLDHGESTLLGRGILEHSFTPEFQLEIQRKGLHWRVFTTDPGIGTRTMEIEYSDLSPVRWSSGYFAIYCRYTVTRRDKFFFDNFFFIPEIPVDTIPPSLIDLEVSTPRQLILAFSEPLDHPSASNTSFYRILPDIGNPILATLLADPTMVQLDLAEDLDPGDYHLEVNGLEDTEGHIASFNFPFTYRPVVSIAQYDILINEIFDDPTPVIGLPEAEYIELFINTNGINLNQLQLQVGSRIVPLPDRLTSKGEYIVVHDENDSEKFASIANAIAVKLPALVNSGSHLKLLSSSGIIIHSILYDDNWYRETTKANGGWSLEMINPGDPCALAENWRASQSLSGGTPGMPNSVLNEGAPNIVLQALTISPIDSFTLLLSLNKSLPEIPAPSNFMINPSISISWITLGVEGQTDLIIKLESPLQKGTSYELILDSLVDCSATNFSRQSLTILIPEKIEPGDLLINEILFDPHPGGDDFLEIYNASSKALQLSDLHITNSMTSQSVDLHRPFLILPGTYAVICENTRDLQSRYTVTRPEWVIENQLPSLNVDGGNITLFTTESGSAQIIDEFDYREDMHHKLLKETKGVSLERISPYASGQNSSNWHSAARASGYATPTSVNSQYSSQNIGSLHWDVSPKILSPDGDGFDDYTLISYKQLDPGSYAHIKIYDAAGRMVRYLSNNESLATEGFIQWDGTTDLGTKAPIGIYSIFIQVFNLSGKVNEIKETCVVAARLN